MIKLFQREMLLQAVLIFAALLLLWGRALMAPTPMATVAGENPAVLYSLLCRWLTPLPLLAVILAMVLVLTEGVMLNLLLANVGLVSQNSLLPTLLYVAAASAGCDTLTPILLANGLAIAALHQLMLRGTLLTIMSDKICGATMLLGIATLFYQPAVFLMVGYIFIAFNYRLYNWKDWAVMLMGFAIPYVILTVVAYLCDDWHILTSQVTSLTLAEWPPTTDLGVVATIVLLVIGLWSLVFLLGHMGERPVLWQKNASTVMLLILGGTGMLLFRSSDASLTACFAIPFAFTAGRLLTTPTRKPLGYGRRKKNLWLYDILLILILIAAILC